MTTSCLRVESVDTDRGASLIGFDSKSTRPIKPSSHRHRVTLVQMPSGRTEALESDLLPLEPPATHKLQKTYRMLVNYSILHNPELSPLEIDLFLRRLIVCS